ncbi:hypothetical protein INP83_06870 [Mucilaginibacter sp. 21P]|uniref:hypothetical protein n=1 Tax=Mucilaginibacter sp. 21P TaxID=2778902 RepID=UPI001C5A0113|nr:hypothetical protein [Mucilaginibacter sp. 21P]QXV66801.1 hypothetical protein INP83_06870 [Mucilaginibacter sp. 21P]
MKKSIMILVAATLFAACQTKPNYNGVYVAHLKGQYSIADDTLIVKDDIVTRRTGFRKIRSGILKSKEYSAKVFRLNSLDAPLIQFGNGQLTFGTTIYRKLP